MYSGIRVCNFLTCRRSAHRVSLVEQTNAPPESGEDHSHAIGVARGELGIDFAGPELLVAVDKRRAHQSTEHREAVQDLSPEGEQRAGCGELSNELVHRYGGQ